MVIWKNIRTIFLIVMLTNLIVACAQEVERPIIDGNPTDTGPTPTPPIVGTNIKVTQTTPAAYQWTSLIKDRTVYVDRSYTYQDIPNNLVNLHLLQTANEDKTRTNNNFISFNVNKAIEILVAHDDRITAKPNWLQSYNDTSQNLNIDGVPHSLYKKDFAAGTVTIGGNGGIPNSGMYTVILNAVADPAPSTGGGNAIPSAQNDTTSTNKNSSVRINVGENDSGLTDTPINTAITVGPTNGTANVLSSGVILFTPANNFVGNDSFSYMVTDANGDNDTAVVTVTVNDINTGGIATPVANDDTRTTEKNTLVDINVIGNDSGLTDTPIITTIFSDPTNGTAAVLSSGAIRYTPTNNYIGNDSFEYKIQDTDGDNSTAIVTIIVNDPNIVGGIATPLAADDASSTVRNTFVNINVTANDSGLADTPYITTLFSGATNGVASVQTPDIIRYTPKAGFIGNDSFVYSITDKDGDMATATVTISVTCPSCAVNTSILLSWNQNPDSVLGYKVYYAASTNIADATTLIDTVSLSSNGFSPTSPSKSYDAWTRFGLNKGDSVCFVIRAYNAIGTSTASNGVCKQIPL
ncbi:MAG: Ig-like domain-containing protein [Thiohalomonadales bacterium]